MSDLSLPALLERCITKILKAFNLPPMEDEYLKLLQSSMRDLKELHELVVELSMFSPNELLEDILTPHLLYLIIPFILGEVQGRLRTTDRKARMDSLVQTEKYYKAFTALMETYQIVPKEEYELYSRKASTIVDPAKRRELKINQFKKEKELRARVSTIKARRGQPSKDDEPFSILAIISSLIPPTAPNPSRITAEEDIRESTLLLLRLAYAEAQSQLESMGNEFELLRNAPPSPEIIPVPDDERGKARESQDELWKLDAPLPKGGPDGKGPLLDPTGKPLRPFTILPSDAGERSRLQKQVFGPGHNLPTMSIDEYLEIERQRGSIITGGGKASEALPTSSEQLALDAEMDGTAEGELKEEMKRQKDENWARFTDENPKGAGNTMNRG